MSFTIAYTCSQDTLDWQLAAVELAQSMESDLEHIQLFYFSDRSIDDELERAVVGDITFFATAFIIMIIYSAGIISKFSLVHSR